MSLARIREYYRVPAYKGATISFCGESYVIVGSSTNGDMRLRARPAEFEAGMPGNTAIILHPTWRIEYPEPYRCADCGREGVVGFMQVPVRFSGHPHEQVCTNEKQCKRRQSEMPAEA